jgi:hypothetical protein
MNDRSRTILKSLFIIAAFGFMAYYLISNWSRLDHYDWQLNYYYLIASMIMVWLYLLGPVIIFKLIFKHIADHDFSFPTMFKIFNLSFIGRYLPGKLWSVVGIVYYTSEYGISKRVAMAGVIINEVCFKSSGLLLGLLYFAYSGAYPIMKYMALVLIVVGLIAIHPRILQPILNYLLKLLKKDQLRLNITYSTILGYFFLYLIFWSIYSLSFYLLIQAISPVHIASPLKFLAILPLAWTVGYLAIFIPGGVGVREGMLVALLTSYITPEIALVIALAQRLISTAVEGINALISLLIKKRDGSIKTAPK